jgi:hypothetical protein
MIARPKISRNERKTAERGAFEVGNVALFCCPDDRLVRGAPRLAARDLGRQVRPAFAHARQHALGAVARHGEGVEAQRGRRPEDVAADAVLEPAVRAAGAEVEDAPDRRQVVEHAPQPRAQPDAARREVVLEDERRLRGRREERAERLPVAQRRRDLAAAQIVEGVGRELVPDRVEVAVALRRLHGVDDLDVEPERRRRRPRGARALVDADDVDLVEEVEGVAVGLRGRRGAAQRGEESPHISCPPY